MKGDRKKRTTIFKKGNKIAKGKRCTNQISGNNEANTVHYVRPTPEEADLVDHNPMQPLAVKPEAKSDKPNITYKMLRSLTLKGSDTSDEGQTAADMR